MKKPNRKDKLIYYGWFIIGINTSILIGHLVYYYFLPHHNAPELQRALTVIEGLPFVSVGLMVGLILLWLGQRQSKG